MDTYAPQELAQECSTHQWDHWGCPCSCKWGAQAAQSFVTVGCAGGARPSEQLGCCTSKQVVEQRQRSSTQRQRLQHDEEPHHNVVPRLTWRKNAGDYLKRTRHHCSWGQLELGIRLSIEPHKIR